jgi:hypothetical protein
VTEAEPDPRPWWALPVGLIGAFPAFLYFFIVTIVLPVKPHGSSKPHHPKEAVV